MGTPIGFFSDDTPQDYPELNKCPDCETYFQTLCCPLCGKECPENMRAGNRAPVKTKRSRRRRGNGRVEFVPWYMSAWFIIAMLVIFPIVGLVLLWQSNWKQGWKIAATILLIVGYLFGGAILSMIFLLIDGLHGQSDAPEDPDVTQSAYTAPYERTDPITFFCRISDVDDAPEPDGTSDGQENTDFASALWDGKTPAGANSDVCFRRGTGARQCDCAGYMFCAVVTDGLV